MQLQKPPDLDDNGNVVKIKPPDIPDDIQDDPVEQAKKFLANTPDIKNDTVDTHDPGWLHRAWDAISQPLTHKPSDIADEIGNWIDQRHLDENPHLAYGKGLVAGGLKGVGDLVSGLSSPLNLVTTAATMGEGAAIKVGMGGAAKGLNILSKVLSAPVAAEGIHDVVEKPTIGGKLQGVLQAILGGAGMLHSPSMHAESDNPIVGGAEVKTPWGVDLSKSERIQSPLELYQNYRKDSKAAGIKPLDYTKWDESGRPNAKPADIADIAAPDPTAGTPQFGGRGKPTGSQQAQPITIKPGELEPGQIQQLATEGYKFSHLGPNGEYNFAKSGEPVITESAVGETRPTASNAARQQLGPQTDTAKKSVVAEMLNLPRAIMASTDMSAPLRQGLPLIHKKQFWTAIPDMFRAFGSEEAFNGIQKSIAEKPLFKERTVTLNDGTVKQMPSFARDAGLKLTDLHDLSNREEALMSSWAEKIPGFGKVYRASERSYTAFLNKLRADTFESLVNIGKVIGADGETNIPLARGLADFVNTATGRGSLGSLERSAVALNSTFFAPRLIASRLKMLNPVYYITAEPMVRKEALKSLFAVAAFGNTLGQLGRMAGATVESDPTSSDFGKIKIGNTRLDPFGGFQQYIVAVNRLVQSRTKSSTSGNEYNLGEKFGRQTRLDVLGRFAESKLNPVLTLATLRDKDFTGQPVNIPEEVASRFVPILIKDVKQLATENPNLIPNFGGIHGEQNSYDEFHPENLPFAVPSWFGMGVQNYKSKGQ